MGGDEFCLLSPASDVDLERLLDEASTALAERGEGFEVTSSFGAVLLPEEASDPSEALRLADERLYAQKHAKRSRRERPHALLMQVLYEREPELHSHTEGVADLTLELGRRLGLEGEALHELHRAAQLHDVGKLAIPDEILHRPGLLDDEEWDFVRRHTLVGERSSPSRRCCGRSEESCARPTSVGTARGIPTGSQARRFRSRRA
ncbi:MAG: HD-GYP domain-containing protein [Gaiella sp.]